MPVPYSSSVVVFILGLASSLITAIIASLFLVEIVNLMPMERRDKINLVIISCFSIGLGAVLTPLGEPLSTIAVSKLQGAALYFASFWYPVQPARGAGDPGSAGMRAVRRVLRGH